MGSPTPNSRAFAVSLRTRRVGNEAPVPRYATQNLVEEPSVPLHSTGFYSCSELHSLDRSFLCFRFKRDLGAERLPDDSNFEEKEKEIIVLAQAQVP